MTKIYLFCRRIYDWPEDVIGAAMDENGRVVGSHISSSEEWARKDLQRQPHLDHYGDTFPDGYTLEWVPMDAVASHPGLEAALMKREAMGLGVYI